MLLSRIQERAVESILSAAQSGETYENVSAYVAPGIGATSIALEVAQGIKGLGADLLLVTQTQAMLNQLESEFNARTSNVTQVVSLDVFLGSGFNALENRIIFSTFQYIDKNGFWELLAHRDVVIVFLNMSFSKSNKGTESIYRFLQNTQLISISSSLLSSKDKEIFGEPVFSYTVKDAIRDRLLEPVKFNVLPHLDPIIENFQEANEYVVTTLLTKIIRRGPFKLLIVCTDVNAAKSLLSIIESTGSGYESIFLTPDSHTSNIEIDNYCYSQKYLIGISVGFYRGLNIHGLTDVIILKKIRSENSFLNLLSKVNRPSDDVVERRVWDFYDNARWFQSVYGEINHVDSDFQFYDETFIGKGVKPSSIDKEYEKEFISDEENEGEEKLLNKSFVRKLVDPKDDEEATIDLLGREGLVKILKGVIDRDSRKHFIVALFGRWGSGKSSVIEILKSYYKSNENTHFITFNAWQHGHSQNMTASVAETCVQSIYKTKSEFGKIVLSLRGQFQEHKSKLLFYVFVSFIVVTFLVFYLGAEFLGNTGTKFSLVNSAFYGAIISVLPALFWGVLKNPFVIQVERLSKQLNFGEHIGVSEGIKQQLKGLFELYPKTILPTIWNPCNFSKRSAIKKKKYPYKYILVVDDLDRCSDDKIIEVLETVQLVVDLENVVVILVVDDEILLRAVGSLYLKQRKGISNRQAFKIAREFLGKILQITITLDKPSINARESFIRKRLYSQLEIKEQVDTEAVGQIEQYSSKYLEEEVSVTADDKAQNLFDYENYYDESSYVYDDTDEYLDPNLFEFEFFKVCTRAFDIDNPRTMIRLHNIVTFLKGLYPEVGESEDSLKVYIFLVFWYEKYQLSNKDVKEFMMKSIDSDKDLEKENSISRLASAIEISSEPVEDRKKAIYRIKNLSLPVLEVNEKEK